MTFVWSSLALILAVLGIIAYDYELFKMRQNQSTIQQLNHGN